MGHYFNKLHGKIIRANNLLQLIHQVTIEFRLRKSLAQEIFKSNLELRYKSIVSSIKLRKDCEVSDTASLIKDVSELTIYCEC